MSKTVKIIVDQKPYEAEEGSLLIDLLIKHEIKVPYFCYHESLGADGNCRMCMVGIVGQKRPQIACDTLIKEGLEVNTQEESIQKVRTDILELELINHPVDCPTCDQAGECSLQDFYMDYGLHNAKVNITDKVKMQKHVDLGSHVMLDQERCVLCARCTRFTDQITHTHELGIIGRGNHARVSTMPGKKLDNPYAMNVVDLCPVGALTSADFRFSQRVWFLKSTEAICQGCAKGCNIYIDHNKPKYQDDRIYRFRPRRNDDVNGFYICDAGRLSYKLSQENRLDTLQYANSTISEEEALQKITQEITQHRGNIALVIDANLYTEEIVALIAFAQEINAKVYTPLACYHDDDFGDEMLRSSQRAANAKTVQDLQRNTNMPHEEALLLNFNHPQPFSIQKQIHFTTHLRQTEALQIPLSDYTEHSGTLTNEDGIIQHSQKALSKNSPMPTVLEWLEKIRS